MHSTHIQYPLTVEYLPIYLAFLLCVHHLPEVNSTPYFWYFKSKLYKLVLAFHVYICFLCIYICFWRLNKQYERWMTAKIIFYFHFTFHFLLRKLLLLITWLIIHTQRWCDDYRVKQFEPYTQQYEFVCSRDLVTQLRRQRWFRSVSADFRLWDSC